MSEKLYEEVMDLAVGLHLTGNLDSFVYALISSIDETDTERLEKVLPGLKLLAGTSKGGADGD